MSLRFNSFIPVTKSLFTNVGQFFRQFFVIFYANTTKNEAVKALGNGNTSKKLNGITSSTHAAYSTVASVSLPIKDFKLHKLDDGPKTEVTLERDDALKYYKQMQIIRRMETAAGNLYKEKKIRGFCHLYSGQEAVAVGMCGAFSDLDAVITAYRCHGWTYMMGATIKEVLAELTGRVDGNVYGKGGSMHMYTDTFYGGNGIVGAQIPLGVGVGFAQKYRKENAFTVALYGDGAANQGQFFEAANMAKLWGVPCVMVCENNGYGMGTATHRASASLEYFTRGDYVPGIWVDAMDVLAVREATRWAREYCVSGHGPLVMEMATYRYHGHSMSDPGTSYRTREEIQEVRKSRDPITGFKDKILSARLAEEGELKEIEKEVRKEVDEAGKQAVESGLVPSEALFTDIYADTPVLPIRGATPADIHIPKATHTKHLL